MPQFSCAASTLLIGNRLFNLIAHLSASLGPGAQVVPGDAAPGLRRWLCPGFPQHCGSVGAKGQGWGLSATSPSQEPRPWAGHGARAGSSQQLVLRAPGPGSALLAWDVLQTASSHREFAA